MKQTIQFKVENKERPELSIDIVFKVMDLFTRKRWPIKGAFEENVFDNFCKMLAPLDVEQREFLLSLSEDFITVDQSEYLQLFEQTFDSMLFNGDYKTRTIALCPLISPVDFGKDKSSLFLLYLLKSQMKAMQKKYKNVNITFFDNPESVNLEVIKAGAILCLIDDFIGTGETAEATIEFFLQKGIIRDSIIIVSIAGMKEGIERIRKTGNAIYSKITCNKGITDSPKFCNKRGIMESIEERINVKEEYRFGYGASEGLIKMINTPNNTFPVYWLRNKKNVAPFPRG